MGQHEQRLGEDRARVGNEGHLDGGWRGARVLDQEPRVESTAARAGGQIPRRPGRRRGQRVVTTQVIVEIHRTLDHDRLVGGDLRGESRGGEQQVDEDRFASHRRHQLGVIDH